MKGFVGIVLTFVPELLRRELQTPIHLAFSYDEEIGCVGVRRLLDILKEMPIRPKACIIGEPTSMKVTVGHKGKKSVRCHVRGFEAHSSLAPRAVNAVEMAAEVIVYLRGMGKRFAAEGPFDDDYDVPHTTVHTGVIHGGTALNIVPKDCHFDFEFRYLPDQDVAAMFEEVRRFAEETLQPAMRKIAGDTGFTWQELSAFPGLATARRQRDRASWRRRSPAATPPSRSPSAPRPGCSTRPAFPPSSAAPAASTRPTSRTSG